MADPDKMDFALVQIDWCIDALKQMEEYFAGFQVFISPKTKHNVREIRLCLQETKELLKES